MVDKSIKTEAATETKPAVKKTADERLNSALKGFAPVVEANVSEAAKRREVAETHVKNLFAGVAAQLDPAQFEATPENRDVIAKAFSSLKRSQTAFLKAIDITSDDATTSLPGVVAEQEPVAVSIDGE